MCPEDEQNTWRRASTASENEKRRINKLPEYQKYMIGLENTNNI